MKKILKKMSMVAFALILSIGFVGGKISESDAATNYGKVYIKIKMDRLSYPEASLNVKSTIKTSSGAKEQTVKPAPGSTYTVTITGTAASAKSGSQVTITYFDLLSGKKTKTITLTPSDFKNNRVKNYTIKKSNGSIV